MSLPGAATEKEDPALFETLSRNVSSRDNSPVKELKDRDTSQILEIESHLIENLSEADNNTYSTSFSGVVIDELPPAEDELEKNSQIESETSPKTVIGVEPAVPKVLQSVEVQLEQHSFGVATIILDNESEDLLEAPALVNQLVKNNKDFEANNENVVDENFNTKEKISQEDGKVAETVKVDIPNEIPVVNSLTEDNKKLLENKLDDLNNKTKEASKEQTLKDQVFVGKNSEEIETTTQEHLSIDFNGLPLPSTPLEEEEKKRFLDSIPDLENNSDSIAVSKQAKKEYYQSLRKYLIHEEANKPPVPLQTYRWEDLRRAREKVGFGLLF